MERFPPLVDELWGFLSLLPSLDMEVSGVDSATLADGGTSSGRRARREDMVRRMVWLISGGLCCSSCCRCSSEASLPDSVASAFIADDVR